MHRLSPIEGLRGYLAMWVLLSHVLAASNYLPPAGIADLIYNGSLAVRCFMVISGFVIFMLLDQKKEHYGIFILRRFFRIFPIYLVLFLLSIPCFLLARNDLLLPHQYQSPESVAADLASWNILWADRWYHVFWHVTMLHGLVPEKLLYAGSTAFLGPAWSLSLEWQFYLLAPLWFAVAVSGSRWSRLIMYGGSLFFIVFSARLLPAVGQGAALPFQVTFFLLGMASYFLYRLTKEIHFRNSFVFPMTAVLAAGIFESSDKSLGVVPYLIWALVLALIIEKPLSASARLLTPVFTNPASLWIGKISYSIYLSHALILIVCHYLLLKYCYGLTKEMFFLTLLALTLSATILISSLLYCIIEAPFIEIGRRLAHRWSPPQSKRETHLAKAKS